MGWGSARTVPCWPPPVPTGPCGCGTGPPAPARALTGHAGDVYAVAFSPDGALLATVGCVAVPGGGGTVRLWDPAVGTCLLTGPSSHVYGAAFSPDGVLLATASWDNTARLWR